MPDKRHAPRLTGRQAAGKIFVDRHLQVRGKFGIEIRVQRALAEERPQAAAQAAHAGSSPASLPMAITRSITLVRRSQ